ncbi:unnamed protein product [Medioppia subpectinata]|uniref:Methyltransferase domain-containing protein n=1 Tax=Medioppia subpectinata TaxID=1979941 RepID=A0A7R9KEN2_9ACAR|nr:unnamed protein product [Medioppia subpectinata]CAG2101917.1 unnamed protein product [Medioppia subpectinata]
MDLGSGDGKYTTDLASRVPHRRVVAVDIDPAMTEYARAHNTLPTIEYVTQDMSVQWSALSPEIRLLEGKIDVIFAHFSLQYMSDKNQLMSVCRQLLATGGTIHAAIYVSDLNLKAAPNKRREWCPSVEQQAELWRRALTDNGLAIDALKITTETDRNDRQNIINFMPTLVNHWRKYFETDEQFESEKSDLFELQFDADYNAGADAPDPKAWTHFLANENIKHVLFEGKILRFIGPVPYFLTLDDIMNKSDINVAGGLGGSIPEQKYLDGKMNSYKKRSNIHHLSVGRDGFWRIVYKDLMTGRAVVVIDSRRKLSYMAKELIALQNNIDYKVSDNKQQMIN